ncbi:hypothetical protein [Methylocella sp.]|uniref:hypothetical protein n=1 Tax=Methylocella sp. TaxID=1978226 RepID=UPI0037842213
MERMDGQALRAQGARLRDGLFADAAPDETSVTSPETTPISRAVLSASASARSGRAPKSARSRRRRRENEPSAAASSVGGAAR